MEVRYRQGGRKKTETDTKIGTDKQKTDSDRQKDHNTLCFYFPQHHSVTSIRPLTTPLWSVLRASSP